MNRRGNHQKWTRIYTDPIGFQSLQYLVIPPRSACKPERPQLAPDFEVGGDRFLKYAEALPSADPDRQDRSAANHRVPKAARLQRVSCAWCGHHSVRGRGQRGADLARRSDMRIDSSSLMDLGVKNQSP